MSSRGALKTDRETRLTTAVKTAWLAAGSALSGFTNWCDCRQSGTGAVQTGITVGE
jgi:hypothetical protein